MQKMKRHIIPMKCPINGNVIRGTYLNIIAARASRIVYNGDVVALIFSPILNTKPSPFEMFLAYE
jgi:hypothetical protein